MNIEVVAIGVVERSIKEIVEAKIVVLSPINYWNLLHLINIAAILLLYHGCSYEALFSHRALPLIILGLAATRSFSLLERVNLDHIYLGTLFHSYC